MMFLDPERHAVERGYSAVAPQECRRGHEHRENGKHENNVSRCDAKRGVLVGNGGADNERQRGRDTPSQGAQEYAGDENRPYDAKAREDAHATERSDRRAASSINKSAAPASSSHGVQRDNSM